MAMRRLVLALLSVMLLTVAAASRPQTSGTADPPKEPPQKKSKKVWTTEDLSKIRGGVSVVGEKPAPPKTEAGDEEADEEEGPRVLEPESAVKVEPCLSRSWSAAVDAVLSGQGVSLGRDVWMDRFFGGDLCPPALPSAPTLAKRIDGDHFLEDGTKVKLQAVVFSGSLPANDIVAKHDGGTSFLLLWKGHPYVTTSMGGVVLVSQEGRQYEIQDIGLYDPYEDHQTKFSIKKGHLASEIDAMVEIRVTR